MSSITFAAKDFVATSSRWELAPTGSLTASWAGQSLAFTFIGTSLRLKVGPKTTRKYPDNGGTPMIAISTSPHFDFMAIFGAETFDPEAGTELTIVTSEEPAETVVHLMLTDWASVFELESLIINPGATVRPVRTASTPVVYQTEEDRKSTKADQTPKILFIGDSISCGMVDSKEGSPPLMPLGCVGAFPFATQRMMAGYKPPMPFTADLLAFPSWNFVSPSKAEEEQQLIPKGGLESKFWKMGPWSLDEWTPDASEKLSAIVVALGTNDDCVPGISPERFANALATFLSRVLSIYSQEPSGTPIFILPPWIDANCPQFALAQAFETVVVQRVKQQFGDQHVSFCPIVDVVGEETVDGIHPNVKGHERLAESLTQILAGTGRFEH